MRHSVAHRQLPSTDRSRGHTLTSAHRTRAANFVEAAKPGNTLVLGRLQAGRWVTGFRPVLVVLNRASCPFLPCRRRAGISGSPVSLSTLWRRIGWLLG